jgi:multicomponent Na+:H+ antiporter subunit G
MDALLKTIGIFFVLVGTLFSIIGVLGILRLPDTYSRLQTTGKISVFGCVFLTIAAMCLTPLSLGKGMILIFLLLLSGPTVAHALASAAYRTGVPMQGSGKDEI